MSAQYLATLAGHGNDLYFGNVVRASIALIAFRCCCQNTKGYDKFTIDIDTDLPEDANGIRVIKTYIAPVIILTGSSSFDDFGLSVPNQAAFADCPIVCIKILNNTSETQSFDIDPNLSRLKNSDTYRTMVPGYLYQFCYYPTENFWYGTCQGLTGPQ